MNGANVPDGFPSEIQGVGTQKAGISYRFGASVNMNSCPNRLGGVELVQALAKTTYSSATSFSFPLRPAA